MAKNVVVRDSFTGRRGVLTETEYNRRMAQWSAAVQSLAEARAAAMVKGKRRSHTYKSGRKAGKTEQRLRGNVRQRIVMSAGEFEGVGFRFPVHGIFREYGVGRGTPRGLANMTRRTMSDWLSGALKMKEEELVRTVAEFQGGRVIRAVMGGVG